jgi:hypothetical protein
MLACIVIAVLLIASWSRAEGWGPAHVVALGFGTVLTYAWVGLRPLLQGRTNVGAHTGPVDVAGQAVLILAVLGLLAWGLVSARRTV